MSETDPIHRRGQALEDAYFQRVDQELIERLRQNNERETHIKELMAATGIHDEDLFEHLLEAGIDASNVAALALTPLVYVAWADGSVSASERQAVISAALKHGINGSSLAYKLLEHWLHERPGRELWDLWKQYARDFYQALPPTTAEKMQARFMEQAHEVAKASGGMLGIGKICDAERHVLDQIAAVFPKEQQS